MNAKTGGEDDNDDDDDGCRSTVLFSSVRTLTPSCPGVPVKGCLWAGLLCTVSVLLHQVLNSGQRLRNRSGGLCAAGLLGQLEDGHVAQRAHFPNLQPLDEAPGRQELVMV